MVWKFQTTGAPTITPGTELPENTVYIHRPDYYTTVKKIDPNKADKLIGVHTAVTQQNNTEYKYLAKKVMKMLYAFQTYPANFHDIWILYTTVLIPSLCFLMPAVTFTEKQMKQLQKLYMPMVLRRAKIGNGYPEAVVYDNKQFQGHNFYHLKAIHIASRLQYILKHIRANDYIGTTTKSTLNWAQQNAGTQKSLLMMSD
eukprot:6240230-Ditylum_brightwellii.AAC.1